MPKRTLIGTVTSDKTAKTRVVEVPRLVRHPMYGKTVRRRTKCHVHDEANESKSGDRVEIVESRPRSRLKRWELVRVVDRAKGVAAAQEAAALADQQEAGGQEASEQASSEPANTEQ